MKDASRSASLFKSTLYPPSPSLAMNASCGLLRADGPGIFKVHATLGIDDGGGGGTQRWQGTGQQREA